MNRNLPLDKLFIDHPLHASSPWEVDIQECNDPLPLWKLCEPDRFDMCADSLFNACEIKFGIGIWIDNDTLFVNRKSGQIIQACMV
jgi:hypothetical protein